MLAEPGLANCMQVGVCTGRQAGRGPCACKPATQLPEHLACMADDYVKAEMLEACTMWYTHTLSKCWLACRP